MTTPFRAIWALAALFALTASPLDARAAGQAGEPDEATRYGYAESLYRQGAYELAVAEFDRFARDYPRGPYTDDAYYRMGVYYTKTGRTAEGLDQFKIIIALLPDGDRAPDAQFEIARYWYDPAGRERDLERAIAEFLKMPFFYPDSPLVDDAAYYAALCQAELGRYQQAEADLAGLVEKYPASEFAGPALYRLGVTYLLDRKPSEALAAFQAGRDSYPAGLYSGRALAAVELVARARDRKPPVESYRLGGKGDAPGKMYKPSGAACGPDGTVYVADTGNSRVQRFVSGGGALEVSPAAPAPPPADRYLRMDEPEGVAVGADGRLYVADGGMHRIQVFDPDGALVLSFGKRGSGQGELSGPCSVAVDEGGRVYVADNGNKRVSVFDSEGRFERSFGPDQAVPERALRSPVAVALGIRGEVLVADNSTDSVSMFDRTGTLVSVYRKAPSGGFELKDPTGLAVDGVGNVYVSDAGRGTVVVLDMDLVPLMEFPAGKPSGVAVCPSGGLLVTDSGASQVAVMK